MARIVLGSYMVRYPLGGMMSWVLQYLVGFQKLGHDVYFVERADYPDACYDPVRNEMVDDPSRGIAVLEDLLSAFELEEKWCFVDVHGRHYGLDEDQATKAFDSADLFVDMGTHGAWLEHASRVPVTVLIDGEPGFTQMKMERNLAAGEPIPRYDRYFTAGRNIGTPDSSAPTADQNWGHVFHPVVTDLFPVHPPAPDGPVTTVMNWQSYEPLEFESRRFGHKDVEFERFFGLPARSALTLELAVAGAATPVAELHGAGWRVRDAHEVTRSFDSFRAYISGSLAEFSVCKNGYVATNSGWFSDRSAAYLASGRPVVQQETGFSRHLPCGEGLFAVSDLDEAGAALDEIAADPQRHSKAAVEIAEEYLSAERVLARFLEGVGL